MRESHAPMMPRRMTLKIQGSSGERDFQGNGGQIVARTEPTHEFLVIL